jgi:hypothetical protein
MMVLVLIGLVAVLAVETYWWTRPEPPPGPRVEPTTVKVFRREDDPC